MLPAEGLGEGAGIHPLRSAAAEKRKEVLPMRYEKLRQYIKNMVLAAMFMAIGLVLPFLTGQIPQVGNMMLPMHLPVLLCGLICGWQYGGVVGFVLPLFRYTLFGAPPMPVGIAMAFELAAYGAVVGFLYARSRWQCVIALYRCLIAAMIAGRIVWAAARMVLMGVSSVPFTWEIFLSSAVITAIPGIILQLIAIPAIMVALNRTGLVPFRKAADRQAQL